MQSATMGRAEQQARWLLWQMGQVTVDGGGVPRPLPPDQQMELPQPDMRRSRYNAVIRRMQQAGQRTGTYTPWA